MSPITVHRDDTQPPRLDSAADITSADPHQSDLVQAPDAIGLDHGAGEVAGDARHCAHQRGSHSVPTHILTPTCRTDSIHATAAWYSQSVGCGSVWVHCADTGDSVHQAARAQSIDTPGSYPGHDTAMADRWLPDVSELTDMALRINMRRGGHTVSRHMSPVRSVTPPGRPSRSGRASYVVSFTCAI